MKLSTAQPLTAIFEGWEGYQTSLLHAIAPLSAAQLGWRPAPNLRSIGEVARHIALGRLSWFRRMAAPDSAELSARIPAWETDSDGNQYIIEDTMAIAEDAAQLAEWLEATWQMIDKTLTAWTVDDLATRYQHRWNGTVYAVSRQWTIWRIMAHDIHHGGELSLMLGMQGVEAFELSALGGHITLPPTVDDLPVG